MEEFDQPRVVIASSNLSLPRMTVLTGGPEAYLSFLEQGNFDWPEVAGMEWTPVRFPAARRAGRILARNGQIAVLHESWREGSWSDLRYTEDLAEFVDEASVALAFPMLDRSYRPLERLQRESPQDKLPIIIHPEGQALGDKLRSNSRPRQSFPEGLFGAILVQPTAEWARSVGIRPDSPDTDAVASQIDEALQERGFGMALDLHHIRTLRAGARFSDPVALVGALAARLRLERDEVQLSVRPEFGGDRKEAAQIFREGVGGTVLGDILEAVRDGAPKGTIRLVSEMQDAVIRHIVDPDTSSTQVHATVNDSVRELMAA